MDTNVIRKNVTHLRFSFSLLLLPVFLFGLSQAYVIQWFSAFICFFVLHFLVYPSSNAYNSYMDKDTGSIGGLKHPPEVPKSIFLISIVFDLAALVLSFVFLGMNVFLLILCYIIASRTYSYRGIRLKRYPLIGFFIVAFFQGSIIYLVTLWSLQVQVMIDSKLIWGMLIAFFMMGSSYPLTQVYQHKQDMEDGVFTLSMLLGIRGTFIFSGLMLFIFSCLMITYLFYYEHFLVIPLMMFCTLPVGFYFSSWFQKTWKNELHANFENTMRMSQLGAWSMNVFFILFFLFKYFNIIL